jgi:putative dimethyl sulfoxide reductase chaperone
LKMDEMILRERTRGDCYRFLSACFCQPQKNAFQEEKVLQNLTKSALFSVSMEESILKYGNEELLVEYSRLFLGPLGVIAPPYGSVYLDGERRVMGDSTMEVIRRYRNEGLSGSSDATELPDHVAVELEFMSFLVFKEIKALETSDLRAAEEAIEKQERFSGEFLRRWIPAFCERIKENTENAFYAALAQCASTFIESSGPADLCDVAGQEKLIVSR